MGNVLFHVCITGKEGQQQKQQHFITFQNNSDANSNNDKKLTTAVVEVRKQQLPRPKTMLWGCKTVEEHYQYIKDKCNDEIMKNKHGEEGLALLGFEYRIVHNINTCECNSKDGVGFGLDDEEEFKQHNNIDDDINNCDFDDCKDDEYIMRSHIPVNNDNEYRVEVKLSSSEEIKMNNQQEEEEQQQQQQQQQREEFMVPIGKPLNDYYYKNYYEKHQHDHDIIISPSTLDLVAHEYEKLESNNQHNRRMRRISSAASMFSLATHHTYTKSEEENDLDQHVIEDSACTMRLYHIESNQIITEKNHETYIAHGKMYNIVAKLCMEVAQQIMIEQGQLKWITLCEELGARALISCNHRVATTILHDTNDNICNKKDEEEKDDEQTTTSSSSSSSSTFTSTNSSSAQVEQQEQQQSTSTNAGTTAETAGRKKILVIITGKGEVGAGIFSRRHLMTGGIEISTALPFIREAMKRNMDIVLLDPNIKGSQFGMQIVEKSLENLFFYSDHQNKTNKIMSSTIPTSSLSSSLSPTASHDNDNNNNDDDEEIYILAHSMAGSQLVRFLHNKTCSNSSDNIMKRKRIAEDNTNSATMDDDDDDDKEAVGLSFLHQIRAIAFTDSNHNINWIKKPIYNHPVMDLITADPNLSKSRSLYIKSHRVHEDSKAIGQVHHDCNYWKHRFGNIRTLWAGTNEHALTNYTARYYIWDHFDHFLELEQQHLKENGNNSNSSNDYSKQQQQQQQQQLSNTEELSTSEIDDSNILCF